MAKEKKKAAPKKDANQLAKSILDIATGEKPKPKKKLIKNGKND